MCGITCTSQMTKIVPEVKKRWRHLRDYRKSIKRRPINKGTRSQCTEDIINIEEELRHTQSALDLLDACSNDLPLLTMADEQDNIAQEIYKAQDIFEVEPTEQEQQQATFLSSKLEIDDTVNGLILQHGPPSEISSTDQGPSSFTENITSNSNDNSNMNGNGHRTEMDAVFRLRDDPAILLSEIFRDIVNQASKEVHPIKKLFDCFADCVVALPDDLQRDCKNRIMLMISEYEETASYRKIQND